MERLRDITNQVKLVDFPQITDPVVQRLHKVLDFCAKWNKSFRFQGYVRASSKQQPRTAKEPPAETNP